MLKTTGFQDSLRIIRHLNFLRIWNIILLKVSYFTSRFLKKSLHAGMPFSLSIEPTTACNLGCPECPSGLKQFSRPTGKLDLDLHKKILAEVKQYVFYINYYFQGEPFLHPQFIELIKEAKRNKIYTSTSTNAHFIDYKKAEEIVLSGLDRLIISIDGFTQSTYEQYRVHGQLNKVLEATTHLVAAKKELGANTPYLIFQILAVAPNENEIKEVLQLGKDMDVDEVRIKTAQLYDYKNGHPLMPQNESYSRYRKKADGTYVLKYKLGNYCWRMWSGSVFTWDGKLVPCCFDKDAKYQLGDITGESLRSIWKSDTYNKFRKQVFFNRKDIDICQNCSEGSKVWI
jgi:radical SAM protein with 4Fe4S-binding SPASM domain